MANLFLTTRRGKVSEIPLYRYRLADRVLSDEMRRSKFIKWLKYSSEFPIYSIGETYFLTFEKLSPEQLNSQYYFESTTINSAPFDNTQSVSNIISNLLRQSLSQKYTQFQNDNVFVLSEIAIYPFKLLKAVELNVEVFSSGDYLIHLLPVTKIVSSISPITESYLAGLRSKFREHGADGSGVKCTLIEKGRGRRKFDLFDKQANEDIKVKLKDGLIELATFDYHFLASYSSDIFHKIIAETSKKLKDIIWFTDKILSEISLPERFNLATEKYLKSDITPLAKKNNLYVGCQYDEKLTFYKASSTQYGLRVEYTRDDISAEEILSNIVKDKNLSKKISGLQLPATVWGKVNYSEKLGRAFLVDIYVDGEINASSVSQQSAAYHNGIYFPVKDWVIQPILYGQQDISVFHSIVGAFNKDGIEFLEPYMVADDTVDIFSAILKQFPKHKKVFLAVLCKYQMPTNVLKAIKSLKRKYQIYLGDIADNKDDRAKLSNYACKCLEKMDGIISLVADSFLPDSAYFIGLDLGHTTHGDKKNSNLGAAIFNNHGLLIGHYVLKDLPRNESLNTANCKAVFKELNCILAKQKLIAPTHIVLHRDGKLHNTDTDSLVCGIREIWGENTAVDIVEIIKSGYPIMVIKTEDGKAVNPESGYSYQDAEHRYALLVTNTQADEYDMLVKPIVIKHKFGNTEFPLIVEQVYWLTKIYTNNLFNSTRLPATTQKANNISGTSGKVHQATYKG